MKLSATPFIGSNIGDGFGEVPAVTIKILDVVLAFAVGMILRFSQNSCTVLPCALAVTLGIFDANLNMLRVVGRHRAFGDSEAALAGAHLYAVVGDSKTNSEPKSFGEPSSSNAGVWVNQHRNHSTRRDGPIESHLQTLSLMAGQVATQARGWLVRKVGLTNVM